MKILLQEQRALLLRGLTEEVLFSQKILFFRRKFFCKYTPRARGYKKIFSGKKIYLLSGKISVSTARAGY